MSDLPATKRMPVRPVYARWLRRMHEGPALQPPTEAEKHDAIMVLRDYGHDHTDFLVREAQAIFNEASS